VTDAAAVKDMTKDVHGACLRLVGMAMQPGAMPHLYTSTSQQKASTLSANTATALQCAGWLVAARQAHQVSQDDLLPALAQCITLAQLFLDMLPAIGPDLLQAVLRPSGGASHVPGGYCLVLTVMINYDSSVSVLQFHDITSIQTG
jgi:hypothetical protein